MSSTRKSEVPQNYLPRGAACVSCRRRKMKCDGQHPVCGQCDRAGRPDDCEYVLGSERSTVQILEDNISRLEARIQELQSAETTTRAVSLQPPYSSSGTPSPPSSASSDASTSGVGGPTRSTISDPPKNVAEALLAGFMPYAADFGFFLNLSRFRTSMFQPFPPGHPARPAPALIFSIYLWAIRVSPDPTIRSTEEAYVKRAIQEAATTLSGNHPKKEIHSIQAEVLLATYFFSLGRFLEGKYHVANAVSTSLSIGLHKIRSSHNDSVPNSTTLPRPQDSTEEGERIIAAWTVFNLDKAWALALDSEPNFRHSTQPMAARIDTPWPLEMEEFEQGALPQHARTANTVLNFLTGTPTPDTGVSTRALEAKAFVLWERVTSFVKKYSSALSRPDQQNIGPILQEFTTLANLLDAQIACLPPITSSPSTARLPPTERTRRVLVTHSILGAAMIRLHTPFAAGGRSESSRRKKIDGAKEILGNLLSVRPHRSNPPLAQVGWLNPVVGSTWVEAAQVLLDEISHSKKTGTDERGLSTFLQQAVSVMGDFGFNIPLINFQVHKVQDTFSYL
ncbi:hypothetical protein CPB83DRAFT_898999 [Crepidotus variabilis]|uniref:Zn(2)-C6 fungal-type domain-containing protein n=1 Tax=Crepidotus variabilis TaxID=179855 RepID=A0A9P6E637_9AGAR|nr:hypothetical protein CPB83DRAFT_898999 [Crepidotus variabilis]